MRTRYLITVLLVIFSTSLFSQQLKSTLYNVDKGLPTDVVKSIVQDKYGFIWFGADDGVVRFDGEKTRIFNKVLPSNYIKWLYKTREGRLFVVCDLGVVEIISRPDTAIFKVVVQGLNNVTTVNDTTVNYPKSIYEDYKGRIWISDYYHVICIQNNKIKKYLFPKENASSSFQRSFSFAEDGYGKLWATSFPGFLYYFDEKSDKFVPVPTNNVGINAVCDLIQLEVGKLILGCTSGVYELKINQKGELESTASISNAAQVSSVCKTNNNQIYFGTYLNGLYRITKEKEKYLVSNVPNIPATGVYQIYKSDNDDLWVCTNDGLNLLQSAYFLNIDFGVNSTSDYVQSFTQSGEGAVYVSTGSSIMKIDKQNNNASENFFRWTVNGFAARLFADGDVLWIGDSEGSIFTLNLKTRAFAKINTEKIGRYCLYLTQDVQKNIWFCEDEVSGVIKIDKNLNIKIYADKEGIESQIYVVKTTPDGKIYCGGKGEKTYFYMYDPSNDSFTNLSLPLPFKPEKEILINDIVTDKNNTVWLGTSEGLLKYKNKKIELVDLTDLYTHDPIKALSADDRGIWIANSSGLVRYVDGNAYVFDKSSGLPANTITPRNLFFDKQSSLWIGTAKGAAASYNLQQNSKQTATPALLRLKINGATVELVPNKPLVIAYNSYIETEFVSLSYPSEKVKYQYRIVGFDNKWSRPSEDRKVIIPRLNEGKYTIEIKALLIGNNYQWSQALSIDLKVLSAWYTRWWAIMIYIIGFVTIVYIIVKLYTQKLERDRDRLEKIVKVRTAEVNQQKEEIMAQKEALETQNDQIRNQNQHIVASIKYAQTIQNAILPSKDELDKRVESHIIYLPKDIVSGDFYWFHAIDDMYDGVDRFLMAVVDCTGHGVPGAFMSMIGNRILFDIVTTNKLINPSEILNRLNDNIIDALRQTQSDNNDGMDLCMCLFEKDASNQTKVTFCGAKRPLFYYKQEEKEIKTVNATRKTIGGARIKHNKEQFENTEIIFSKGDMLYLTTDGMIDITGPDRRRFGTLRFVELLNQCASLPLETQKEMVETKLIQFQGNQDQRDDITIAMLKII